jgi:hypothetical protein
MRFAHTLRFLSLPAAIALGAALAVACSDGLPTSADQSLTPSFAPKKGGGGSTGYYDDDGSGACKNNDTPVTPASNYDPTADVNGNTIICFRTTGGGGKKK